MTRRFVTSRSLHAWAIFLVLGISWLMTSPARAQTKKGMAGPSLAVTPEIVDAIAGEIERAMQIPGTMPPYFIAHKITEVEVNDVVSSLGSTTSRKNRHFASVDARVRVGSYDRDNSNFVVANFDSVDGWFSMTLPTEATPRIARRVAWLVTDTAYKEALEQLRAKIDTGAARMVNTKSYSRSTPVVKEDPVLVPALEKLDDLEARANHISAVFRGEPHIRDSRVAFTSFLERRWYLNSEGTSTHDTRRVSGVLIAATAQAEDGQELALYHTVYGLTDKDLPSDKTLMKEARELSDTLAKLRQAPIVDNYTGPVLFEGVGAADIIRYTLAPHLDGTPIAMGLGKAESKLFGGGLSDRLGQKVTSSLLSIVDDPTATRSHGTAMIGGFQFDDEGVPSQAVTVVKDGRLETLLTSRTPSDKLDASNGHARRVAPGGIYHGSATNLIVHGRRGVSRTQLVKKLLAEVKDAGVPYGIIIRRLDDPAATALPELSKRELLQLLRDTDSEAPPVAALAYRVYPDGREELVRGVQLEPVTLRAWKDVIAVGKDVTVFNYLASGQPPIGHKVSTVDDGSVPSSGVESAIVTPDLLFQELEIKGSHLGTRDKPVIPRPGGR